MDGHECLFIVYLMVIYAYKLFKNEIFIGVLYMRAIILLGDIKNETEIARSMMALLIAWKRGLRSHVIVSGEISLNSYTGTRFDHVIIDAKIPLDLKAIVENSKPLMVIEDSKSKERLMRRREDLRWLDLQKAFVHLVPVADENLIVKLKKLSEDEDLYVMEVGL